MAMYTLPRLHFTRVGFPSLVITMSGVKIRPGIVTRLHRSCTPRPHLQCVSNVQACAHTTCRTEAGEETLPEEEECALFKQQIRELLAENLNLHQQIKERDQRISTGGVVRVPLDDVGLGNIGLGFEDCSSGSDLKLWIQILEEKNSSLKRKLDLVPTVMLTSDTAWNNRLAIATSMFRKLETKLETELAKMQNDLGTELAEVGTGLAEVGTELAEVKTEFRSFTKYLRYSDYCSSLHRYAANFVTPGQSTDDFFKLLKGERDHQASLLMHRQIWKNLWMTYHYHKKLKEYLDIIEMAIKQWLVSENFVLDTKCPTLLHRKSGIMAVIQGDLEDLVKSGLSVDKMFM